MACDVTFLPTFDFVLVLMHTIEMTVMCFNNLKSVAAIYLVGQA